MHTGIVIDIDPVFFSAGPVTIRWYGLMISIAILSGVLLAIREASRRGISEDDILYVTLWGVPAALIGARLFHVIDALDYYSTYPLQILAVQEGGLAIYGGLIGGLLAGALAARRRGLLSWGLLDIAAPSLILGQAIGRVGCFINGDHEGTPTNLPWATSYIHPGNLAPDSQPRQPAQLYEMIYDLLLFGLLLLIRRRVKSAGVLFGIYVAVYAFGRFWISALREGAPFLAGLKEAQVISIAALVVAVPLTIYLWRQPVHVASSGSSPAS